MSVFIMCMRMYVCMLLCKFIFKFNIEKGINRLLRAAMYVYKTHNWKTVLKLTKISRIKYFLENFFGSKYWRNIL